MSISELRPLIISIFLATTSTTAQGQSLMPIGSWRMHISFNKMVDVVAGTQHIYAAAPNGVMIYDKNEKSISVLHKGNGLSNTGVVRLAIDPPRDQLIIAYDNGTFDLIRDRSVSFFDPARNTVLTGPRKINDIFVSGNLAYLSTDYGVLLFDLQRGEIKETWRDLGPSGSPLRIFGSVFFQDSVFLSTESGVMAGSLNDNLLDFNKWKRFVQTGFTAPAGAIAVFDQAVYVGVENEGLHVYRNGTWSGENAVPDQHISALFSSSDHLLITGATDVYRLESSGEITPVDLNNKIEASRTIRDNEGSIRIASLNRGLLTYAPGIFSEVLPNGPPHDEVSDLVYRDKTIYMISGGHSSGFEPLNRRGLLSSFQNGMWNAEEIPMPDLTGLAFHPDGSRIISSFGHGILAEKGTSSVLYNESNSTLLNRNTAGREVFVTAVTATSEGIYAANYDVYPSIHFFHSGSWQSLAFPVTASRYPVSLITDSFDNVWVTLAPGHGGGLLVFNRQTGDHHYLTSQDQQGELPSNAVYTVTPDRDGNVWVGTDAGVAYFFDVRSDAVKPLFENRFLLRDDRVKVIAVDGGNRKWIGTERGVWLFSPSGEEALLNFTAENSPLLSNNIIDIEIDPSTGEVFFATDRGIVSYRSDATRSEGKFAAVKIFPNPVTPAFTGHVGISGLATDAIVKITDISGRLVWQTQANGGTASWHVRDHSGRRVNTGVYFVFAIRADGGESIVGKIAVVN